MRPIILLALLLAACSADTVIGPAGKDGRDGLDGRDGVDGLPGLQGGSTVKSGTRLKARVARSEDGASQFLGWWDSELGVECEWNAVASRCLPAYAFANSGIFADDACTVHAVQFDGSVPFCQSRAAPDELSYYYPFGAVVEGGYRMENGTCITEELSVAEGAEWRACGDRPAIPRESFALMPVVVED